MSQGQELAGQAALVTGAASGIGAAIAARFREAGARVVGIDRAPGEAIVLGDVADDEGLPSALASAQVAIGQIDLVVHAAALCLPGGIVDTDLALFRAQHEVNLLGAVRLMQYFAPGMMARRSGSFILLSSINARFASPSLAAYATTKAGVESLMRTAAAEFAPHNVRVNAIAPASVDTPMLRAAFDREADPQAARDRNVARHPIGRLGLADEVAELALFLASPRAGWITGAVHSIDGGAGLLRA